MAQSGLARLTGGQKVAGSNPVAPTFLRGMAQSGLARLTGGQKVAGSNPVAPIFFIFLSSFFLFALLLICCA